MNTLAKTPLGIFAELTRCADIRLKCGELTVMWIHREMGRAGQGERSMEGNGGGEREREMEARES
jgi:hypothetical protein